MPRFVKSRFFLRTVLGRYPALYYPICGVFRRRARAVFVRRNTELVIMGFPRSANTFVSTAFEYAQEREVRVVSYLHVAAQIIRGVRLGIPSLVLIRNPEDAVASYLVFSPGISVRLALWGWSSLYETMFPYREGFITATFETATRHVDAVVKAVNARFETDFAIPVLTDQDVEQIFRQVEEKNRRASGGSETTVARPSSERAAAKQSMLARIKNAEHHDALQRAQAVYQKFVSHTSVVQPDGRISLGGQLPP